MVWVICVVKADWLNRAQVLLGSRAHSAPYGVIAEVSCEYSTDHGSHETRPVEVILYEPSDT